MLVPAKWQLHTPWNFLERKNMVTETILRPQKSFSVHSRTVTTDADVCFALRLILI